MMLVRLQNTYLFAYIIPRKGWQNYMMKKKRIIKTKVNITSNLDRVSEDGALTTEAADK